MAKKNQEYALKDPNTGSVITMDYGSSEERSARDELLTSFRDSPIPDHSVMANLGLHLTSKTFSRMLFMNEFYKMGLDVMGQVFDFGTRWGHNMAIFIACRGMYEPFNRHRKIVGFDTFGGFPTGITPEDGQSEMIGVGNISVSENYMTYLDSHLALLEKNNALPHLKKYELVQGDASETIKTYFTKNPHALVSHAFFDFDLYEPTRHCLETVWERASKGAVFGFDEINDEDSPGETQALMDFLDLSSIKLQKFPWVSRVSYFVKE